MTNLALSIWQHRSKSEWEGNGTVLKTSEQSDLDGLRALDHQVITAIHNRFFQEIYRYARYRLGDETVAEDIAGETFTRLLESITSGRGPKTSLRGWLLGTASNLINDHMRNNYTHPTEKLPEDMYDDELNPIHFTEQADRSQMVRQALAKLTPDQQQVITLRFGNGLSVQETASLMDKKENAVKALQFRALAALRRSYGENTL